MICDVQSTDKLFAQSKTIPKNETSNINWPQQNRVKSSGNLGDHIFEVLWPFQDFFWCQSTCIMGHQMSDKRFHIIKTCSICRKLVLYPLEDTFWTIIGPFCKKDCLQEDNILPKLIRLFIWVTYTSNNSIDSYLLPIITINIIKHVDLDDQDTIITFFMILIVTVIVPWCVCPNNNEKNS